MAIMALAVPSTFACGDKDCAKSCSIKGKADASKTDAKLASSKGAICSPLDKKACASKASSTSAKKCTAEELDKCLSELTAAHAKSCDKDGKCELTAFAVTGMTCAGCEQTVSSTLASIEGVKKVVEVCHEAGLALCCVDGSKVESEALTRAIADKGYKAEIIPAVAKIDEKTEAHKKACGGAH
jgi:copper chaperone CopZ